MRQDLMQHEAIQLFRDAGLIAEAGEGVVYARTEPNGLPARIYRGGMGYSERAAKRAITKLKGGR